MKTIVAIPARYASTRFPGKPLAPLAGEPMIAHVVDRALTAGIGPVLVATDDARIAGAAAEAGAETRITRGEHDSGTERVAEAIASFDCDIVVNLQGDEPLIEPDAICAVARPFEADAALPMATLAHLLRDEDEFNDPNVVKVVLDARDRALYFSRAPIPHPRRETCPPLKHVGIYAYRRSFLLRYADLPPAPSERAEGLEQLRALHHGFDIAVTVGDFACVGVDTPGDLARAESLLAGGGAPGDASP